MNQPDPALFYDFDKLAAICKELDFNYEQPNKEEFKITLCDNIHLIFVNLTDEQVNTMVYMEGGAPCPDITNLDETQGPPTFPPSSIHYAGGTHTHGIDIDLGTSVDPDTFEPTTVHYLDIPLLIRTGEILVYERYWQKSLHLQWLVYHADLSREFADLEPGEEVRIIRL